MLEQLSNMLKILGLSPRPKRKKSRKGEKEGEKEGEKRDRRGKEEVARQNGNGGSGKKEIKGNSP